MKIFTAFSVFVSALNVLIVKPHKRVVFLPPLVLFCSIFGVVLPSYIPALGVSHLEEKH